MSAVPTYTREEVIKASLDYFAGDELQAGVFTDKYALRDREGRFYELTPRDMHRRLAREFARIEANYPNPMAEDEIFDLLDQFQFVVPQGSPMFGIGNPFQAVSTSNCAVIPAPKDTMSSIFDTARDMANLYKRRFGVGTDLSGLRPAGASVSNAAITSTGAWSFADFYSYVTRMVGQSGRRGALMLTMDVRHPDIEQFITMKKDLTKVTGANVSVKVTDDFMRAVETDSQFLLRWPVEATVDPYREDFPEGTVFPKVTRWVRARDIFNLIAETATQTAEPGLLYWDTIKRNLPLDGYPGYATEATNPCGEVPLCGYDSCRLLSIYLPSFVKHPFTPEAHFDWVGFATVVWKAQRLADDLVDLELEKLRQIHSLADTEDERALYASFIRVCEEARRTGVGTHGLADALARLRTRYDTEEGLQWADAIYRLLKIGAYQSSVQMAKERGPFPIWNWEHEKNCAFFGGLDEETLAQMAVVGRRNGALLTNAPTGSVSILSNNCSSGIEPVFMNSYMRNRKVDSSMVGVKPDFVDATGDAWVTYAVYHRNVEMFLRNAHLDPAGYGLDDPLQYRGMTFEAFRAAVKLPDYFVTAGEIDPIMRVRMQATIQQHIDHSLSSTLNLPRDTKPEVVANIYTEAWKAGCKGVTVYRDGSREAQVLSAKVEKEPEAPVVAPVRSDLPDTSCGECLKRTHRGTVTGGTMFKAVFQNMENRQRKVYVYVGANDVGQPVEVFVTDEQGDEDLRPYASAVGKLVSLALKHGIEANVVAEALTGLKGGSVSFTGKVYQSVPDLIGKRLSIAQETYEQRQRVQSSPERPVEETVVVRGSATLRPVLETGDTRQPTVRIPSGERCPECGQETVYREGGCPTCKTCGWAKCA